MALVYANKEGMSPMNTVEPMLSYYYSRWNI